MRAASARREARDAYEGVPILQTPTWNNEVAAYFFLGGISSGSFVLGALAELVGKEEQRELAAVAHIVSFATVLACPPLLIDDLGKPSRFHHMLRVFKPSSPMNLGSWALTGHGAFAALLAMQVAAKHGKIPLIGRLVRAMPTRAVAAGGLPTALALGGYTGVLLGTTSVPVWSTSPLLGGLFMASAVATGSAGTRLASLLSGGDPRQGGAALDRLTLVLGSTELAILGGYLATTGTAVSPLLRGREGALMLGAVGGTLAALALDAAAVRSREGNRILSVLAAFATLAAGACLRWSVVRAGHVSAADREQTLASTQPSREAPGWGPSTGQPADEGPRWWQVRPRQRKSPATRPAP
jgi:formate-dependent nitrite reductase membrane component NrfD